MSLVNAYRKYSVSKRHKKPLLDFVTTALETCGCTVLAQSLPDEAPFRVTFARPSGERVGILVYAFYANSKSTKNRPEDEWRFQVKFGSKTNELHEIWQDPYGLYITLFLGISPEEGFFVGADPVLNSPTPFFISKEFKKEQVNIILRNGWYAWEREQREGLRRGDRGQPTEVLVGGTSHQFLRYVLLEREALGEDQGHRHLLAEKATEASWDPTGGSSGQSPGHMLAARSLHLLEREFQLPKQEILNLIQRAPRLKMAVRGWVAEEHLFRIVRNVPGVTDCQRIEEDGRPDLHVSYKKSRPIYIECKNVLRKLDAAGVPKMDLMKSRESKTDPCRRYYRFDEFDLVAACLHATTEKWEFRAQATVDMDEHASCPGHLHNRVAVGESWTDNFSYWFERVLS